MWCWAGQPRSGCSLHRPAGLMEQFCARVGGTHEQYRGEESGVRVEVKVCV